MDNQKAGKAVKAALKNISCSVDNVSPELAREILDATKVKLVPLDEFTHDSAFKEYMVSYRDGAKVSTKPNLHFTQFSDDDRVVNILSKRYELLQHDDVIKNVTDVLDDNGVDYTMSKLYVDQRHGSNKLYASLTLDGIKVDIDGSPMSPCIDVFNSTDGSLAAGILFGAYRFKCKNGMLLGTTYGLEKVIHSPSAIQRLNFGAMFNSIQKEFTELGTAIEQLQEIKYQESMLKTLKTMHFNSMFIKHYDAILEKYMIENHEDVDKSTAWGVYATATNFISNYIMLKSVREAIIQQKIINKFKDSVLSQ